MKRLEPLDESNLTQAQQEVLDAMGAGPRGPNLPLVGPFAVWARSPSIGDAVQRFGGQVRFATRAISEDAKEVAICTVGAHFRAKFEFGAHAALAVRAGVAPSVIDAIRDERDPLFDSDAQRLAWEVSRQLLQDKRVADAIYAEAFGQFGEEGMIELVSVIGYYMLVSVTLNLFQVELPEEMLDPFPDMA